MQDGDALQDGGGHAFVVAHAVQSAAQGTQDARDGRRQAFGRAGRERGLGEPEQLGHDREVATGIVLAGP
ncbi:hypothetical protein, partial [Paracidovorax cattleyae]|uniref:hypothetical protein n=1 Tax=Paracidovorax cattleyae TaxID=80868 RepID=UPI001E53045B